MFQSLFDEVYTIVSSWVPKETYSKEGDYRDELTSYLRKHLNESSGGFMVGPQRKHTIKTEHGRSLADIAIDRQVGIEIKRNLKKKADIDRLKGQVSRFKKDYRMGVIVVLVGKIYEEAVDEVREMESSSGGFTQETPVKGIRTDKKPQQQSGFGGGGLFG